MPGQGKPGVRLDRLASYLARTLTERYAHTHVCASHAYLSTCCWLIRLRLLGSSLIVVYLLYS